MAIRIASEADLPRMLEIYAPYVTDTTCSFEYTPPSPETFAQRFWDITQRFPWLVWEESGKVLGYAYASAPFSRAAYSWCAEPSIYIAPEAQGRGIGRALYAALEALLRAQGFRLLYAIITSENTGSLAFHRAAGYRHLAEFPGCGCKFGKILGITWMEKTLISGDFPSEMPTNWSVFVKDVRKVARILDKMSLSLLPKI